MIQSTLFFLRYTVLFCLPLVYMPTYIHTIVVLTDTLIKRRFILVTAFIVTLMFSIPVFILSNDNNLYLLSALVSFGIIVAVPLGVVLAVLIESFPTRRKGATYSLIYDIGVGILGAVTPLTCTWLIKITGNNLAPAFYLCIF